jgi:hypothetical protein
MHKFILLNGPKRGAAGSAIARIVLEEEHTAENLKHFT